MKAMLTAAALVGATACAHSASTSNDGAAASSAAAATPVAAVQLVALGGSTVSGTLTLTQLAEGGVKIEGTVHGLGAGGEHGFHVHEKGDCSAADGSSAGGHFNPTKQTHGDVDTTASHVGDLGNIKADANGDAQVSVIKKDASLSEGEASFGGRAIVVHKLRDDLKSQPAGASGDRIACGVIKLAGHE